MPSLILASTSAPRKLLLERLCIPFEYVAPNVNETPLDHETPNEMVVRLAKEKAEAVAMQFPDSVIIGADQVGVLDNTILGKPLTHDKAIVQLQQLSGKTVTFSIGLCVLNTVNNNQQVLLENFTVVYRTLSQEMIENYLQKESVLNCAGSFKVEGLGIALVEKLIGADYTALIGLPLIQLIRMLEQAGIKTL
jgi:septum formation protein